MTRTASTLAQQANTKVKLEERTRRLLMEVQVNGKSEWVLLDTGNAIHCER